ncbi:hypothetical protein KAZ01_03715, partial [Candidatus Gracilibacteria bacterium]|nr:hypothetical protein [Candidatus Gracilibacteria bacterium]
NYLSKISDKVYNELLFKDYHNSCYISEKYNILTKLENGNILVKNIAEILINSTMLNYTKIINTFLELNDSKLDIPNILSFSEKIDSLKFDNNIDDFDEKITDIIDDLFEFNTILDFYKIKEYYCSNSKEDFFLKLKLYLIGYILYTYTRNIKNNEEYTIIFPFFITLSKTIQDYYISLIKQKEKEKYEAIIKERDKVIADLSHSIKNFIKSVQDPLQNLKKDAKQYSELIDNTLKGTNLIREIVNAMNLSYVGSINDFYEDAQDIDNSSISLKDIIISAIKSAVPNMFDWKYFNDFNYNYFKDDELFNSAQKEWENISKSNEIIILEEYLKTYFFNITIDLINIENLKLSDKRGSALKMMILFQEIILNAIKYTSYLDKDKRDVKIILSKDDNLNFIVINNYKTDIIQKKSGLGHIIVKNFAKLLNTEPIITKDRDLFKIELIIEDLWRIKGRFYMLKTIG